MMLAMERGSLWHCTADEVADGVPELDCLCSLP